MGIQNSGPLLQSKELEGLPRTASVSRGSTALVFLASPKTTNPQPIRVTKLQQQYPILKIWAFVSKELLFLLDLSGAFT